MRLGALCSTIPTAPRGAFRAVRPWRCYHKQAARVARSPAEPHGATRRRPHPAAERAGGAGPANRQTPPTPVPSAGHHRRTASLGGGHCGTIAIAITVIVIITVTAIITVIAIATATARRAPESAILATTLYRTEVLAALLVLTKHHPAGASRDLMDRMF